MNKQQEKTYKEYVDLEETKASREPDYKPLILSKEEWLAVQEQMEAEEQNAYLEYQKRISKHNKIATAKAQAIEEKTGEPQDAVEILTKEILTKEKWIKAGKPTGETKAERFQRLVEPRTDKVLDAVDKLFSLVSPNYESTTEERMQVIKAIQEKTKALENHFTGQKKLTEGFKLKPVVEVNP